MDRDDMDIEKSTEEQLQYARWKKNTPLLYDFFLSQEQTDKGSLTVQWMPEIVPSADKESAYHKMILSTNAENDDPNYLLIADVLLPSGATNQTPKLDSKLYNPDTKEVGRYSGSNSKIDVKIKIVHEGEVNRARVMPQNHFVVATKSPNADVLIFNYSKHPSFPTDKICKPQHRCRGHSEEGYGLCWSPFTKGRLISGSNDAKICMWDIEGAKDVELNAVRTWSGHSAVVSDVDFHKHSCHLFGSVSDDSSLKVWDLREQSEATPMLQALKAHDGDANCLSFNPFSEFLLASGGTDNMVHLWDLRCMLKPLHSLEGHEAGVYQVSWSPHCETVLASSSADGRINIWDVSRIGAEQAPEDSEFGDPALLFIHGGHKERVNEFSWNVNTEWMMASVSEDYSIQVWQMSESNYIQSNADAVVDNICDDDLE